MLKSIDMSNIAQTSHILGLDFGESKIGLAIADEETKMAFALNALKNDSNFVQNLKQIIAEKHVTKIVMGMVKHEKDPQSAQKKIAFAKTIMKETGIKVFLQDEMFTTKMAQVNIKMRGSKNIAATDDQEAARIILQEWLDNNYKV